MATANPSPVVPSEHSFTCPSCSYPLPPDAERCPECAYEPTHRDRLAADRRAVFLELTQTSGLGISAVLGLICLVQAPWGLVVFAFAMSGPVSGQVLIARGSTSLHARLARAAWRYSVKWLLLPWIIAATTWMLFFDRYMSGWQTPPEWLSLGDRGMGGVVIPPFLLAISLGAYRLWRWSWLRACRAGAVPDGVGDSIAAKIGARCVLYPWVVIASIMLVGIGAVQVLDRVNPGWSL